MKKLYYGALIAAAALFAAGCATTSSSASVEPESAEPAELPSYDFEDGSGLFLDRGGGETVEVTTEEAYEGTSSLKVTNRTSNWNGATIELTGMVTPGGTYAVTAYVKASAAEKITLSTDTTNSEGSRSYGNLASVDYAGDGTWVLFDHVTFTAPEDAVSFSVYFEAGGLSDIYIDNFEVTEAEPVTEDAAAADAETPAAE